VRERNEIAFFSNLPSSCCIIPVMSQVLPAFDSFSVRNSQYGDARYVDALPGCWNAQCVAESAACMRSKNGSPPSDSLL
jgi:hypothetical protein